MILAGSGHRPECLGYGDDVFKTLVSVAKSGLKKTAPTEIISGMALGWDQALARAAVELGIPFTAAVPFKEQSARWLIESIRDYFDLLKLAKEVVYVCPPGYSPAKLHLRNEWMVNHSDGLIVLYDGDKSGGTAACIKYAESVDKPVVLNLWDEWVGRRNHASARAST